MGRQVRLRLLTSIFWLLQRRCNHQAVYVDQWKHWNPEIILTALADLRLGPRYAHRQMREPRDIERSLEKSHIWPQSVSWTRSGLRTLKRISDFLHSGADSLQSSGQRKSLAFEKANTKFKPTVFRRPGHPLNRSHIAVVSRYLQPRSLHPPFLEDSNVQALWPSETVK